MIQKQKPHRLVIKSEFFLTSVFRDLFIFVGNFHPNSHFFARKFSLEKKSLTIFVEIFVKICRTKKRVVFADDKGKSLTEIRVMSEPSNVPPLWSIEFLSHVTQGFIAPDLTEEWTVTFKQPASDYLNFRYDSGPKCPL